jgi:hypothetical protein
MADAAIPVNLFNPGQVFASLGFLEVADVILGNAEGGFDWSDRSHAIFRLRADGAANPAAAVLQFLAEAEVRPYAPAGFAAPTDNEGAEAPSGESDGASQEPEAECVTSSESFPAAVADRMALPIRLQVGTHAIDISHWADDTRRHNFKLYAGNRTGYSISCDMLRGKREKPKKRLRVGQLKTLGVASLWSSRQEELTAAPFDVSTPMGGSFNFDPRGGWTAIDAGYSPNEHGDHVISASPVVEILAACGLEHARPTVEKRQVLYGAWGDLVPPILARPALSGLDVPLAVRRFRFTLGLSGKNKVVTFSQEENRA